MTYFRTQGTSERQNQDWTDGEERWGNVRDRKEEGFPTFWNFSLERAELFPTEIPPGPWSHDSVTSHALNHLQIKM